jgi:uncharacterized membrane protein
MKVPSVVRARVESLQDALRTQLWPVPLVGILLGFALGVALPAFDRHFDQQLPARLSSYLFGGAPSAARTLLGAVVSSTITVTSLTFSLTVVTLQLASSQFSPRLLRTFSRDRFVHVTLALFLATFTYALAVLRTVRDPTDGSTLFVPQLSVSVAFLLCLLSVVGLVVFLAHLARQIRVETMLVSVHNDATDALRRILPPAEDGGGAPDHGPVPPTDAVPVLSPGSGFLVTIDEEALLRAATEADGVLLIDRSPGGSLVEGTPVGVGWARAGILGEEAEQRLRDGVAGAVVTGIERTAVQDVGYGLKQLTDVCTKALSPGINDPTTAIHALGHTSALLCELADRNLSPRLLHDEEGALRVIMRRDGFAELLEESVGPPRRYGAADPFVLGRLFALLREVAWHAKRPEQREAITSQLARLRATVGAQDFDDTERARLRGLGLAVEQAQAGTWPVVDAAC